VTLTKRQDVSSSSEGSGSQQRPGRGTQPSQGQDESDIFSFPFGF
jgi:hypothetical protein